MEFAKIDTRDQPRTVHFFWTTGIPYDMIKNEYGANPPVQIGGSKLFADHFPQYLTQFLNTAPENTRIVFVADKLTLESNQEMLNSLTTYFPNRFKLKLWNEVKEKIEYVFPDFLDTDILQSVLEHATCGNPAISSDMYRLVGMPITDEEDIWNANKIYIYSDIDVFVKAFESDDKNILNQYLEALIGHESEESVFRFKETQCGNCNNDIIRLKFKTKDLYHAFVNHIVSSFIKIPEYKRKLNKNVFKEIITNSTAGAINLIDLTFDEPEVVYFTGPGFVKELTFELDNFPPLFKQPLPPYLAFNALSWKPFDGIRGTTSNWVIHLFTNSNFGGCSGPKYIESPNEFHSLKAFDQDQAFLKQYLGYLGLSLKTRNLGKTHPLNQSLYGLLIKNNPYNSEEYKFLLENKLDSKNKEDLRTYLINSQSDYEDGKAVFAGYRSHYYNIKKIFDTLDLTFPILPDGLFEACGKIQDDVHLKIDSV